MSFIRVWFKKAGNGLLLKLWATFFLAFSAVSYAQSPFFWQVFNIPPFGSEYKGGIGFELVDAYSEAGLENKVIVTNTARWQIDMANPKNLRFCTSGSWKLPNTDHRVYSDSIVNTVDYGVAVRPELYKKLSNNGQTRTVDIIDVIEATKTEGSLMIMKGRPVFGSMGNIIDEHKNESGIRVEYMTASEGPISMLKMATIPSRKVSSVLIFPEEFPIFTKQYPDHKLKYLMLSEGSNFAPIRASCPNTIEGRVVISKINKLLENGLRGKAFNWFLKELPNISEIKRQARINQQCIEDASCKDPLVDLSVH